MTLRTFLRTHREEIDRRIRAAVSASGGIMQRFNDDERHQWLLNDEGLYNWARSLGVKL